LRAIPIALGVIWFDHAMAARSPTERPQFVTVKLMFENEIWACRAVNSPA
jgi:hypothetical protein